jgi:hypothetical protein
MSRCNSGKCSSYLRRDLCRGLTPCDTTLPLIGKRYGWIEVLLRLEIDADIFLKCLIIRLTLQDWFWRPRRQNGLAKQQWWLPLETSAEGSGKTDDTGSEQH